MKMKFSTRFAALVAVVLLASGSMKAQQISVDEALEKAKAFLGSTSEAKSRNGVMSLNSDDITLAYTSKQGDEVHYYAYNNKGGGFVLIGGDKAAREILGYCTTGTFNYSTLPVNVREWLDDYDAQIHYAIEQVKAGNLVVAESGNEAKVRKAAATGKYDIANLISTKWDQGEPYNSLLPSLGSSYTGNYALATGCVATAMAQVMNYWKCPTKGNGSKSYTKQFTIGTEKLTLTFSADFANTTYDWANMADTYSTSYSGTASEKAVATLMYHCGVALNMNYGQIAYKGSSASTASIPSALNKYFGYYNSAKYVERSDYSDSQWEQLIYDELAAGHPIVYRGSSLEGGHAFVCHGYIAEYDYYAFNWGWGGSSDGFYPLTGTCALQPNGTGIGGSSSGSSYTGSQGAVIGIKPSENSGNNAFVLIPEEEKVVNYVPIAISASNLNVGETANVTCPSDYTGSVSYSSSDVSVATVSSSGVVKAVAEGTAIITVKASAKGDYVETSRTILITVGKVTNITYDSGKFNFTQAPYFTSDGYVTVSDGMMSFDIVNKNESELKDAVYILFERRIFGMSHTLGGGESDSFITNLSALFTGLTPGKTYTMAFYHTYANGKLSDPYNIPSMTFVYSEAKDYQYTLKPVSAEQSDIAYGTLCIPMSCEIPTNVLAFECGTYADEADDDVVELIRATSIERNTPYILIGTPGTYTLSGAWSYEKASVEKGLLVGVMSNDYLLDSSKNQYLLQNHNGEVAFYAVGSERNGKPFTQYRSFLQLPSSSNAKQMLRLPGKDSVTAIEKVAPVEAPSIVGIYTVGGARVNQLRTGMNIIKLSDGTSKKVMVK